MGKTIDQLNKTTAPNGILEGVLDCTTFDGVSGYITNIAITTSANDSYLIPLTEAREKSALSDTTTVVVQVENGKGKITEIRYRHQHNQ